ncbi:rnhA operon protein [Halobaculum sp. MBLA0143]|uniref:DUF7108 family protein n=1 Tax=Halobaculum sp. MBLA0143 TaxID=3079933 RepID=UPI003523440B
MTDSDTEADEAAATRAARERAGVADTGSDELPADLVQDCRRLTRLARRATDDDEATAYRTDRDERLADHGFVSRVRETDDTLVVYPSEWVDDDGTVDTTNVSDTDRAYELLLSGAGDPDEWDRVEEHNAEVVTAVGAEHGSTHRRNARAFADFVGNHYAKRVETATAAEVEEFLTEYYPRNAWPTERQRAVVRESVRYVFDAAGTTPPI